MKFKTTAKALRESGDYCVSAGYCSLQYLLHNHDPIAYTSGVYGWNFDVYCVYGLTICTGYRGMVGKSAIGVRQCEKSAEHIYNDSTLTYEEKREKIEDVLKVFVKAQFEAK